MAELTAAVKFRVTARFGNPWKVHYFCFVLVCEGLLLSMMLYMPCFIFMRIPWRCSPLRSLEYITRNLIPRINLTDVLNACFELMRRPRRLWRMFLLNIYFLKIVCFSISSYYVMNSQKCKIEANSQFYTISVGFAIHSSRSIEIVERQYFHQYSSASR